jgi:hypothetical protein
MKEPFIQNSTLNGSLNGHRYVFAGGADTPNNPGQAAEEIAKTMRPIDKAFVDFHSSLDASTKTGNPKAPVSESKKIGNRIIRQDTNLDEQTIQPRNANELAKDRMMQEKISKAAPYLKDLGKMSEMTPNEGEMNELATQINNELPKNLAQQMLARLDNMDAAHADPENLKIILEKVDNILADYAVDKNPRQVSNLITRLGVDVRQQIAQRDSRKGGMVAGNKDITP